MMHRFFKGFTGEEHNLYRNLHTPQKIQDFLEMIPQNFDETPIHKKGMKGKYGTLYSPRMVLKKNKAYCLEGALFAASVLMYHGEKPIILDLQPEKNDVAHTVALYKRDRKWGAISKTNHAVLRFRDPVYKSVRELAMSYFHEYFLDDGVKTLREYATFNLLSIKENWIIDEHDIWYVDRALDELNYIPLLSKKIVNNLRKADPIERKAGKITQYKKR